MDKKHNGSCLCGDVAFEIEGEFTGFFLCHCSRCRKGSGSAHGANLFSSTARISWISGDENRMTFTLPGTRHCKSFCQKCGSALPSLQIDDQLLVVPAGSLDSEIDVTPTAHILCASKANWDTGLSEIPHLDGMPG